MSRPRATRGSRSSARAKQGFYAATVTFGGTHFVRAGTDPNLIPLRARAKRIAFVNPLAFPRC